MNDQSKNNGENENWIELGNGHRVKFFSWDADRELNSWLSGIPAVEKFGLIDEHPAQNDVKNEKDDILIKKGESCGGAVYFDLPEVQKVLAAEKAHSEELGHVHREHPVWTVVSLEPASLGIEPSLLCKPPEGCGDHGFIREGKWVVA